MTSQRIKLAGVAAAALIMLQVLSTLLLWQLLDETREDGKPAAQSQQPQQGGQGGEAPPPLPESRSGGSARALVEELDQTTARLENPLRAMQDDLGRVAEQFSFVPTLPPLLSQLVNNTSGFGALPGQLNALIAQTRTLAIIPGALSVVVGELRRLRSLTASIRRLEGSLGRLEGGIGDISGGIDDIGGSIDSVSGTTTRLANSFDEALVVFRQLAQDVARMRECIETPGVCNATPAGGPSGAGP